MASDHCPSPMRQEAVAVVCLLYRLGGCFWILRACFLVKQSPAVPRIILVVRGCRDCLDRGGRARKLPANVPGVHHYKRIPLVSLERNRWRGDLFCMEGRSRSSTSG